MKEVKLKFNVSAFSALLVDGLLSVCHVTNDGMSFLKPLEITDTHVVVEVPHLSLFGLVWDISKWFQRPNVSDKPKPLKGKVLLFFRPVDERHEYLDVLLLPGNVVLEEVKVNVIPAYFPPEVCVNQEDDSHVHTL